MTAVIDDRTSHLSIPLPNAANIQTADVSRFRDAFALIDTLIYTVQGTLANKADSTAVTAAVNAAITSLVGGAPGALDTLKELADAINDDASFAATVTTALAGKLSNLPATAIRLGGIKVGSGLVVDVDGMLSVASSGGGSGLPAWADVLITPASNGQTAFTVSGGYNPGQIDVLRNGVMLIGNGDDYTATNGTSFTLTATDAITSDTFVVRKWFYIPAAQAVNKTGDTMTGALNWSPRGSIASAATVSLGSASSNLITVTGTTTITSFGSTVPDGGSRTVTFAGSLTLTHNATSLILPTGANIVTQAGDVAVFESLGSGNWRCTSYMRASGQALVAASPPTITAWADGRAFASAWGGINSLNA